MLYDVHYRNWRTHIFLRTMYVLSLFINCSQVMQQRLNAVSKDDYEALYKELQVHLLLLTYHFSYCDAQAKHLTFS